MNFFEGTLESSGGRLAVGFGDGQRLAVDDGERGLGGDSSHSRAGTSSSECGPEHLEDASVARDVPDDRRLQGQVRLRELLGSEVVVHFEVDGACCPPRDA